MYGISSFSRRALPIALIAAFSGHAASADQEMKGVVVSASRSQAKLEDMALNTTVVTREDIRNSPAQTLDQLLATLPGFNIADVPAFEKDPTGQSISMRGLGNARTLVLIDGTPLNDAFYGTVQWNRVPLSSIERVEVIRGGTSSQWGNLAMGGVVNIVTKAPKKDGGEIQASYGSYNTSDLAVAKDVVLSGTTKLRLTADNFHTNGYMTVPAIYPTTPTNVKLGQGNAYARNSNAGVQAYFSPSADLDAYVRAGYHVMKDLSSNYDFAVNSLVSSDVAGGLTKKLDKDQQVQAYAYFQTTQFDKINGSNDTNAPYAAYANATYNDPYRTMGGSVLWLRNLHGPVSQLTVGIDYRKIWGSNTTNNYGSNGALSTINYGKGSQGFYGLLGEMKIHPAGLPLEATIGARYDHWVSYDSDVWSRAASGAPVVSQVPNQLKRNIDPSIALRFDASESTTLRAAAYRAFRAPGMNNMYRSYGKSGSWSFSNPNLKPETMDGREVGADYRWSRGIAKVTLFDNLIKDAVTTYTLVNNATDQALAHQLCGAGGTNPTTETIGICTKSGSRNTISYYTNNQVLRSQGLESEAKVDVSRAWALDFGYAFTFSRLTWSGTSDPIGKQVGGVPKNTGSAGVTWKPDEKFTAQVQLRLVGKSWLDTPHAYPLPGYATANVKVSYRIEKNIEAFASVTNLFDRDYIAAGSSSNYSSSALGMPRAAFAGARMAF